MSDNLLNKVVLYIKDVQEIRLFHIMSDPKLFLAFSGTPLYFMMLPCLGFIFVILALMRGYEFAKVGNKNWDQWLGLSVSAVCASLTGVSLFGGTLASAYSYSFVAGPWFFFSSVALALSHQMVMLGINGYRAYESPKNSSQRMHYIQSVWNHVFNVGLCLAILGTVSFVMLFPVAPMLGTAFALSSVGFTAVGLLWRLIPHEWKQVVKRGLHLSKLEEPEALFNKHRSEKTLPLNGFDSETKAVRIFTRCDYSAVLKKISVKEGEAYLLNLIDRKITRLEATLPIRQKISQKIQILTRLRDALKEREALNKTSLNQEFPQAFYNFWCEKGDVEQLFDAYSMLLEKFKQDDRILPSP